MVEKILGEYDQANRKSGLPIVYSHLMKRWAAGVKRVKPAATALMYTVAAGFTPAGRTACNSAGERRAPFILRGIGYSLRT